MNYICYPKCSTCIAVKKELLNAGINFEERNIKEDHPTIDELKNWVVKRNGDVKKFINTSGQLYKSMNLKDKVKEMSDSDLLELLATDGMLVKRPIMLDKNEVLIGKKEILQKYRKA